MALSTTGPEIAASHASADDDEFAVNRQYTVLLVEDDPLTLKCVAALLRKCKYEVLTATNGREALDVLRQSKDGRKVDLILTDIIMPEVNGMDLITEVVKGESWADVPVIVMSSLESQERVLEAFEAGASDYLIKPVRKNELTTLWQHVWRARRLHSHRAAATRPTATPNTTVVINTVVTKGSVGGSSSPAAGSGEGSAKPEDPTHAAAGSTEGKASRLCQSSSPTPALEHSTPDTTRVSDPTERVVSVATVIANRHPSDGNGMAPSTSDVHGNQRMQPSVSSHSNRLPPPLIPAFPPLFKEPSKSAVVPAPMKPLAGKSSASGSTGVQTTLPRALQELAELGDMRQQQREKQRMLATTDAPEPPAVTSSVLRRNDTASAFSAFTVVIPKTLCCPAQSDSATAAQSSDCEGPTVQNTTAESHLARNSVYSHPGSYPMSSSAPGVLPDYVVHLLHHLASQQDQLMQSKQQEQAPVPPPEPQQPPSKPADEHRKAAVAKYLQKKKRRNFEKKVRYESRKRLAEARPRVRGQFVRQTPENTAQDAEPPAKRQCDYSERNSSMRQEQAVS